jgi:replicative DNA helicase
MTTTPPDDSQAGAAPRAAQKLPPQDLTAERALLGAMMMSRDAIAEVVPVIARSESHWFYLPVHRRLFEVLLDLFDDPTKAVDLVVMQDELRRRDLLDELGGVEYMILLAESFADIANVEHYAKLVRGKGMLRDLIQCSNEITELAYTSLDDPNEVIDVAEAKMFAVTERRVSGQAKAVREAVNLLYQEIQENDPNTITGLRTGFLKLDELTTGLQPGDLAIVAGRPSMGKTALGLTIAHHIAVRDHRPLVFFSMEMSARQMAQRLLCAHAKFDAQRLRQRRLTRDEDVQRLLYACDELAEAPLYIDDTPGMTPMELRAKARRLRQQHKIEAIFVDYLQLMHLPNSESRQVEISTISRGLKSLGRELDVPIISMAQLNRKPADRKDNRPILSDLRESGAIEQDADLVLMIHREEYFITDPAKREEVRGEAELIIAKQRNGPTDTVPLTFHRSFTSFESRHMGPEPPAASASYSDDVPF